MATHASMWWIRWCQVNKKFHTFFYDSVICCFILNIIVFSGEVNILSLHIKVLSMYLEATMEKQCWTIYWDSRWKINHGAVRLPIILKFLPLLDIIIQLWYDIIYLIYIFNSDIPNFGKCSPCLGSQYLNVRIWRLHWWYPL